MNKKNKIVAESVSTSFSLNKENVLEILTSLVNSDGLKMFGGPAANVKLTTDGKLQFELPAVHRSSARKFEVAVTEL